MQKILLKAVSLSFLTPVALIAASSQGSAETVVYSPHSTPDSSQEVGFVPPVAESTCKNLPPPASFEDSPAN